MIVGTVTPDNQFPATACLVQRGLGLENAAGFDVSAACSGFLNVLVTGWQFVASGMYDNVLCIGAESLTRVVDYDDRTSCILFGDGAGAAVLSSQFDRGEIRSGYLKIDGSGYEVMHIPAGGTRVPASVETLQGRQHFMRIRGREVYKFAVNRMVELIQREREANPDLELGYIVPHQVNLRIIESAREKLGIEWDKIFVNIEKYGNTSAASIPIAFDELVRSGKLAAATGKQIIFCAFGAGLTWASASLKW
ncbi:MAG: beta-ketoacyl-ACP synthase 3 [Planctomycetota bacterium]